MKVNILSNNNEHEGDDGNGFAMRSTSLYLFRACQSGEERRILLLNAYW